MAWQDSNPDHSVQCLTHSLQRVYVFFFCFLPQLPGSALLFSRLNSQNSNLQSLLQQRCGESTAGNVLCYTHKHARGAERNRIPVVKWFSYTNLARAEKDLGKTKLVIFVIHTKGVKQRL